jgi:hypothetical protein
MAGFGSCRMSAIGPKQTFLIALHMSLMTQNGRTLVFCILVLLCVAPLLLRPVVFDLFPRSRIGESFEYFPIMLNILSVDKAFHKLAFC